MVRMSPRDAFPGYDDPVNMDMEPEEAVQTILEPETDEAEQE